MGRVSGPRGLSRRTLLAVGGAGLGALALAACAGQDGPELTGIRAGDVLAPLSAVPLDGGYALSINGRRVLITRPVQGTVVAFDAKCTHRGCTVAPGEGELDCPCHGSVFDLVTGKAVHGPAKSPLTPVAVAVRGDDVVLA